MRNGGVLAAALLALAAVGCGSTSSSSESGPKRVALVVGNSAYRYAGSLRNPANDASAVSAALERLGFRVVPAVDQSGAEFRRSLRSFSDLVRSADAAVVFYAGHGMQIDGKNYLIPVDFDPQSVTSVGDQLVSLDTVFGALRGGPRTSVVMLDACRNNPLADGLRERVTRGRAVPLDDGRAVKVVGQGLAKVSAGIGTLIAFATEAGSVASDGTGRNSPFSTGLLRYLEEPGLEVNSMMQKVRKYVHDTTGGEQLPWSESSLIESFYFKSRKVTSPPPP